MNSARFENGEHKVILKSDQEKSRKLNEDRNIAIVSMKRQQEAKKAEKIKKNLHLIDFPKGNTKMSFVSTYAQIKQQSSSEDAEAAGEQVELPRVRVDTKSIEKEVAILQSENKQQYKRLADALSKSETYAKVQAALTLDKQLKGKGKKRKVEDENGQVHYKWFAQRKR